MACLLLFGWIVFNRIHTPSSALFETHDRSIDGQWAQSNSGSAELLFVDYYDEDFGFSMVVPQGWTKVITDEPSGGDSALEPGYSVVFESGRENEHDHYADYVMVEVLPGIETGAFETSGEHRELIIIDGREAVQDKLILRNIAFEDTISDLTVWQAEIAQLGYTVGLYAVGTSNNARMLEDAFRAMVFSFQLPNQPFNVTELGW